MIGTTVSHYSIVEDLRNRCPALSMVHYWCT